MKDSLRSHWKLALIPVLTLLLFGVVWPRSEEAGVASIRKQKLPETAPVPREDPRRRDPAAWNVDLNVIRARNPFAAPAYRSTAAVALPFPQSIAEPQPTIQRMRVDAVLTTRGKVSALVNGRIVQLGDNVEGGGRVIAISHDTITIGRTE